MILVRMENEEREEEASYDDMQSGSDWGRPPPEHELRHLPGWNPHPN